MCLCDFYYVNYSFNRFIFLLLAALLFEGEIDPEVVIDYNDSVALLN
jgi:hypothetical protein